MKIRAVIVSFLFVGWFGLASPLALGCCHHGGHCDDCDTHHGSYSDDCCPHGQRSGHCHRTPSGTSTELQTAEGKITEIEYLAGATSDSGIVEIQLQTAGQSQMIGLAPVGYLRQSGLALREGDTLSIKGFRVAGREGALLVATEIHEGERFLSLRDSRGRPAW